MMDRPRPPPHTGSRPGLQPAHARADGPHRSTAAVSRGNTRGGRPGGRSDRLPSQHRRTLCELLTAALRRMNHGGPMTTEPGRILVVDDEPVVSSMLCDVLATAGYVVASAASGAEALD